MNSAIIEERETCDRPMCNKHAVSIGPNVDYCLIHARMHQEQLLPG